MPTSRLGCVLGRAHTGGKRFTHNLSQVTAMLAADTCSLRSWPPCGPLPGPQAAGAHAPFFSKLCASFPAVGF